MLYANQVCKVHTSDGSKYIGPCGNILDNISGGTIANIIKISICLDLYLTIPLVLAASREIIEKKMLRLLKNNDAMGFSQNFMSSCIVYTARTFLVILVVLLSISIPGYFQITSLVGGVLCSLSAFLFPCLIFVKLKYCELSIYQIILCSIIAVFGTVLVTMMFISS